MAASRGTTGRPFVAALVLLPFAVAVKSGGWIPGLTGRRGGGGGLPHYLSMPYGHLLTSRLRRANKTRSAEDEAPVRHRLVICNAYRGLADLAAIHKRPGDAAGQTEGIGHIRAADKALMSGISFKACDVSHLEFREGDSIVFKMGGASVGSFDSRGALGLRAGQEVSLVVVPYRTGYTSVEAALFSHVFLTPKEVGAQVIIADTLSDASDSVLKMEDRQGRLWPVHHNQEMTLKPGRFQFSALRVHDDANISSTPLHVARGKKDAMPKYLVLRMPADPLSLTSAVQEFITFSVPLPIPKHSAVAPLL